MSDIKLFRLAGAGVQELDGDSGGLEKSLQTLMERHLDDFLGVRFLASEYATGKTHGGRIDTLGLDENNFPVIVEYKRALNENVINQGLFYLDWLLDHKAEFQLLVVKRLGDTVAEAIDWTGPRLVCIAADFTRYDEHAVQQIDRNIELIRFKRFGKDLLLLELINATSAEGAKPGKTKGVPYTTVTEFLGKADKGLADRFEALKAYLLALGDDVQLKVLKNYFAFRRFRNFACVEVHPQQGKLTVFVKIDPSSVELDKGFTRDVSKVGHFGTGDLEITVTSNADFERAKPLLLRSYEAS